MPTTTQVAVDGNKMHLNNEHFAVLLGVDKTTSTFMSIYDLRIQAEEECDCSHVMMNNMGIVYGYYPDDDSGEHVIIPELVDKLREMEERFELSAQRGNHFPNIPTEDVLELLHLMGFEGVEKEVINLLD